MIIAIALASVYLVAQAGLCQSLFEFTYLSIIAHVHGLGYMYDCMHTHAVRECTSVSAFTLSLLILELLVRCTSSSEVCSVHTVS